MTCSVCRKPCKEPTIVITANGLRMVCAACWNKANKRRRIQEMEIK